MWVNATVDCHAVDNAGRGVSLRGTVEDNGEFLDMHWLLTMEDGTTAELSIHVHADHSAGLNQVLHRLVALVRDAEAAGGVV